MKSKIPVVFATSKNMTGWLSVALTSMAENTKSRIDLHIIEDGITDLDKRIIGDICKKYKNLSQPRWYFVDAAQEFKGCADFWGHMGIWARYVVPDLLKGYDKILYLDADLIVLGDIAKLFDMYLNGHAIAAPPEIYYTAGYMRQKLTDYFQNRLGLPENHVPFCTGILIFDLTKWRAENLLEKLKETGRAWNGKLSAPDQDAMNILFVGKYREIPTTMAASTFDIEYFEFAEEGRERFFELQKNIIIHHFNIIKPWRDYLCDGAIILHWDLFWYYAQKTPFADYFKMMFTIAIKDKIVAK
jgi:lipopolysaccharide biosynthesis glycosyltransferase